VVGWLDGDGFGEFLTVWQVSWLGLQESYARGGTSKRRQSGSLEIVGPGSGSKTYTASSKFFSAIALFPKALSSSALMMNLMFMV
jgi:hypothetical protein